MAKRIAVIAGAGPAGLTAALELLKSTDIQPIVYEADSAIGGISRTINYKGNRIDIGGHRFFSKSERVMNWWLDLIPLQGAPAIDDLVLGRDVPLSRISGAPDPEQEDQVMLVRKRISRILYRRRFFDYPLSLSMRTLSNLGIPSTAAIAASYIYARIFPIKKERSLEDFFINRFGKRLYLTFFKDYTEKVWGCPCTHIKPDWGAQRVKGLSIAKLLANAITRIFRSDKSISQKDTETSLIEQFLYPKYGPGQIWETAANLIRQKGGQVLLNHKVVSIELSGNRVTAIGVRDPAGQIIQVPADFLFSSMPVKELICAMDPPAPHDVYDVADSLPYRDFITVGLLLRKLKRKNDTKFKTLNDLIPDTWIYVQEKDVRLGRIQIFNNWSPYMVKDYNTVWLGLEYFCNRKGPFWSLPDVQIASLALDELVKIGLADKSDILDSTVIRVPNTYPGYFGSFDRFDIIRRFTDQIENLFLIGRTGMHRYNNQDHSMLAAMTAVENIINNVKSKDNIWAVNAEQQYLEQRSD